MAWDIMSSLPPLRPLCYAPSRLPAQQGFHQETFDEAMAQLRNVLPRLVDREASLGLAALNETLDVWLSEAAAEITLLPTVRCGLGMAVVHLVARGLGMAIGTAMSVASGLPCRGAIEINGLQTREQSALGEEVYMGVQGPAAGVSSYHCWWLSCCNLK